MKVPPGFSTRHASAERARAIADLHAERHRIEIDARACDLVQVMRIVDLELHGAGKRACAPFGDLQHGRADVGDDAAPPRRAAEISDDAERNVAGAGRDIEHAVPPLGRNAPRHPPLPGSVNAEAEQVAQHVVARRDPREDVVVDGIE
jgi:hypothetical protein